jgi:arylsulfatase A-like enzyme
MLVMLQGNAALATVALVALLAACSKDSGSVQAAERRPDVILIVVDTLRSDHMSVYGYPRPTTPFLEECASQGAVFEDVTTQFSWTMPSMVSMMTGRYLSELMPVVPAESPTLAEAFSAVGYRSLAVVSNVLINEAAGFARGFDQYDSNPTKEQRPKGKDNTRDLSELQEDLWPALQRALEPAANGARPPLFLYVHTFDAHQPFEHHPELEADLSVEEASTVQPAGWQVDELARRGPKPDAPATDWSRELSQIRAERGLYDQEIRYTDEQLRLLFARLETLGLLDHAVVALVADHGEGLWEHVPPVPEKTLATAKPRDFFYSGHGQIQYQEVLTTPFLLWGAGVPRGVRYSEAVENVDLAPTLLELCNVPSRATLHGRSLVTLLEGRGGPWRQFVFSNSEPSKSVREVSSGLKLVVPNRRGLLAGWHEQLYDLRSDPHERDDLALARPDDTARLRAALADWTERHPTPRFVHGQDSRGPSDGALKALGYTGADTGLDPRHQ